MRWDVFRQYTPYREVERRGDERIYAPAVYWQGTVAAEDGSRAIAEAIALGLALAPLVRKAVS